MDLRARADRKGVLLFVRRKMRQFVRGEGGRKDSRKKRGAFVLVPVLFARGRGIGWHSLAVAAHGRISRCNVGRRPGAGYSSAGQWEPADEVPDRYPSRSGIRLRSLVRMCLSNVGWCLARSSHDSEPGAPGDLALEEEVPTWRDIRVESGNYNDGLKRRVVLVGGRLQVQPTTKVRWHWTCSPGKADKPLAYRSRNDAVVDRYSRAVYLNEPVFFGMVAFAKVVIQG